MTVTDNEIVKALECCISPSTALACFKCPMVKNKECNGSNTNVNKLVVENALDLINRQKADIERLKSEVKHFQHKNSELFKLNNSIVDENNYKTAEIERLRCSAKRNGRQIGSLIYHLEQAKSEAYREFADRLHEKCAIGGGFAVMPDDAIEITYKELTHNLHGTCTESNE